MLFLPPTSFFLIKTFVKTPPLVRSGPIVKVFCGDNLSSVAVLEDDY